MNTDLDALATELYVTIDDHVVQPDRRRVGRPKQLTDAELVCLAVPPALLGARSEHHGCECVIADSAPVSIPAETARLPQAGQGCDTSDLSPRWNG
ncbi:putative transposase domain protein [Mycobacterium kansasii 732]|nr:putative transposase domain protein [Mycobacterium kansasii 732]